MVEATADPKVDLVLRNVETMVGTEGGTLELVALEGETLRVKYNPGVNEDCPECVPTHQVVSRFLTTALQVHAPYVTEVAVD